MTYDEIPGFSAGDKATMQISVEYREVGAGVNNVELNWENVIPDAPSVVYILRTLLHAKGGEQ